MPGNCPNRRRAAIGLAVAALLFSVPVHVQDRTAEIDKIFSWVTADGPGCTVAVSYQGKPVVNKAYGLARLEPKVPMTAESVLDAGSVVKQFVAASVLLLVEDGKLSLTEDIHKYIPELPDYGHKITLDHLLTHTSGIRDWTGLGPLTGRQVDALTLTLRQRGLDFAPGEEWSYSNSGYVLLKEIVARTARTTFGDFTRTRLFEPLGMKSTSYALDGTKLKNLAHAYERAGNTWKEDMHVGNARGGGGALFTTASDLVTWNEALAGGKLGKFVTEKIQEPATLSNGRRLSYARGLYLDSNRGSRVIWHSGGAAGYGTFLARFPEHALSVASMCNAGEAATGGAYARRIFDLFVPTTTPAAQPNAPAATGNVEGVDVKARAGTFYNETNGVSLRLVADGNRLRVAGGPALETLATDRFRNPRGSLQLMSEDQFELHFVSNDRIDLKSMEGKITRYRRAEPFAPTPDDLKAFAGRFGNDETKAVFEITPNPPGLTFRVSWNESMKFDFVPVDRDRFQFRGMMVHFRRDNTGKVVGLDYSNPVVRNVAFTRVAEKTSGR